MRKSEAINLRKTENTKEKGQKYKQYSQKTKDCTKPIILITGNRLNTGDMEGLAVLASHATLVVLLLNATNFIWYGNRIGHQYIFCLLK
jgi:hypothetical protein